MFMCFRFFLRNTNNPVKLTSKMVNLIQTRSPQLDVYTILLRKMHPHLWLNLKLENYYSNRIKLGLS
jgi:hypothetical protein